MTRFGYTLMTEQSGPKELVDYAVSAERVGFDFEVCSDHYSPWLAAQGHAPNAWTVLGAVAHATERVELFTYVTCPTMRYHPAVVAQQAATLQILADGRFTLGVGSGENLNEHVVGQGWPTIARRQDMLREAIQIIRELFTGEVVDWKGDYFEVDSARLWDVPDVPVAIAAAVSGSARSRRSRRWSTTSSPSSPTRISSTAGTRRARAPGCPATSGWSGRSRSAGTPTGRRRRAGPRQFRWFAGGWAVNADLPTTAGFAGATHSSGRRTSRRRFPADRTWTPSSRRCSEYWEAGFTDIALVQVGDEGQDRFLKEAAEPLLEKLRAAAD